MYYMLWHGGTNYAVGTLDDVEPFETLDALKDAFRSRVQWRSPSYVTVYEETPAEGGPEAQVWASDPRGMRDPYPDYLLSFASSEGDLHVEEC
jgi:hypothetical protein